MALASIVPLLLASCVLLRKLPNLSVPLFLMCQLQQYPSHRGLVETPFVIPRQAVGTVLHM